VCAEELEARAVQVQSVMTVAIVHRPGSSSTLTACTWLGSGERLQLSPEPVQDQQSGFFFARPPALLDMFYARVLQLELWPRGIQLCEA